MKNRRPLIIIVTVVIGALLWLSVNLREQYQITLPVPLTIEDIPQGMAIRTPVPQTLAVKFRGSGWRLAALSLGPELALSIPISALPPGRRAITLNELADRIILTGNIQIVDMHPDTVLVSLDRYTEKRVPVVANCDFVFRDGYGQVGSVDITPDSVTLGGAEALLASLSSWMTERRVFDDLKASLDTEVPLAAGTNHAVVCLPASVRIRVNIQPFAEKVFGGIPVEVRSLPPNRDLICIPPKVDIVVRGGIRQLAGLISSDFQVMLDYERVLVDTTGTVEPEVLLPPGIHIVSKRPERLQYIVRKRL